MVGYRRRGEKYGSVRQGKSSKKVAKRGREQVQRKAPLVQTKRKWPDGGGGGGGV